MQGLRGSNVSPDPKGSHGEAIRQPAYHVELLWRVGVAWV
jgi:hypothetical protein